MAKANGDGNGGKVRESEAYRALFHPGERF